MLGLICKREHRKSAAIDYFKKSLEIEPTLWSSITELCELGVNFDTNEIFGLNIEKAFNFLHSNESNDEALDNVKLQEQQQETSSFNKENTPNNINSVLLNRQLTESLSGYGSPKSSMSLGLSSMSLRAPFASPGSIPAKSPNFMSTHSNYHSNNNSNHSNYNPHSSSHYNSNMNSQMRSTGGVTPRAALFNTMSTPGREYIFIYLSLIILS